MQVFFDKQRLEFVRRVAVGPSVAAIVWHPTLNQIFLGTGDLSCSLQWQLTPQYVFAATMAGLRLAMIKAAFMQAIERVGAHECCTTPHTARMVS